MLKLKAQSISTKCKITNCNSLHLPGVRRSLCGENPVTRSTLFFQTFAVFYPDLMETPTGKPMLLIFLTMQCEKFFMDCMILLPVRGF